MITVQIVQHLRPGGIETLCLDLLENTAFDKTYCISLEGARDDALDHWPRLDAFCDRLIFLEKPGGLSLSTLYRLERVLRRLKPDVVFTHHVGPLLYGGLASRLGGIGALVHTEHDAWHLEDTKRRRLIKGLIRALKPVLVADAETVARELQARTGLEADRVIRNGVDLDRFLPGDSGSARRRLGLPADAPLIGFAGRLEAVKGPDIAVKALAATDRDDLQLALAGEGALHHRLRGLADSLGVADRTHFLGRLDDMALFYRAVDALALTSRREGYPLAPLEAQACGTPVVAADVGGVRETVCPRTGAMAPAENIAAFAAAFDRIADARDAKPGKAHATARAFAAAIGDKSRMLHAYAELATSIAGPKTCVRPTSASR